MCLVPEGVEVKLSADLIKPLVQNHEIVCSQTYATGRYSHNDPEGWKDFQGAVLSNHLIVENIQVKGKFMYWTIGDWYMFSTFGMTGQWSNTKGKHPCFSLDYWTKPNEKIQTIYFNDPRHFGTIRFTNNKKDLDDKLNELGWDPLAHGITNSNIDWIKNKLNNSRKCIGELLMNQNVFAGVGNYIRSESLYLSGISPWRPACTLTEKEKLYLCHQLVYVMQESYDHQGATILTYKDAFGAEGKYSSCFKVYGKKEDPLGRKIKKEKTPDGRTIHWCPEIQS
jgi:formamidopyrimidine-DNA glycosylase